MTHTIFGLDYQTFWILAGILGFIWLTILFSYWMNKLIKALNCQTVVVVKEKLRGG